MLEVIDTHAHLDMQPFDADRKDVIKRAHAAGVRMINTIGIDLPSCRKAIELAHQYPGVVASVGIHPHEADKATREDVAELTLLATDPRVVAVGEMGLDYHHPQPSRAAQVRLLEWELEMSEKTRLPIIIHCRDAQEQMRPIVENCCMGRTLPEGQGRGVVHCFSGDRETAEWYIARGFYISIGAYVSYPSSQKLRETLAGIPAERLVVETDCPFLPPQHLRGKRNEPLHVLTALEALAKAKGLSPEEMAQVTTENAMRLFAKMPID